MTFSDLKAFAAPSIHSRFATEKGLPAQKVTLSDPTSQNVLSTHSPFAEVVPFPTTGQTARSENVTFAADYEGQSDDPGRFIVEEAITAGRKKS